jgi:Lrp/AsnC family transcriptional regulator, regulator for asnA, asnC and gidA
MKNEKEDCGVFRIRADEDLPEHKVLATLDDLDRDILEMHLHDVFFSYNDLADKWGVTAATIRNRVKRLKARGVMDVILVMNPYKIGYTTFAIIGIRLEVGGDAKQVALALQGLPGVTNIVMVTGRYDFFVHYVCRNTEEYRHFVVDILRKIPDISMVESFIGLDLYERKFELGLVGSSLDTNG